MNANWYIQSESIPLWRNLVEENWSKAIPRERREKNVDSTNIILSKKKFGKNL